MSIEQHFLVSPSDFASRASQTMDFSSSRGQLKHSFATIRSTKKCPQFSPRLSTWSAILGCSLVPPAIRLLWCHERLRPLNEIAEPLFAQILPVITSLFLYLPNCTQAHNLLVRYSHHLSFLGYTVYLCFFF